MVRLKVHRPGFLAAPLVAAALASMSCQRSHFQAEWWQGEQERIALSQRLELLRYRAERSDSSGFDELKRLDGLRESSKSLLDSLRQQRVALKTEVTALEEKWDDFQTSAIQGQRQCALGTTFKTFQSAAGRKFQDVSVAAIDDAGVTIRHADGSARLRFADLDSGQQAFFGLEADLASAAEEKEAHDEIAYDRGIESQMAMIREQEIEVSERARREEMAAAERKFSQQLAVQRVASAKVSPLSLPATRFGSRSWSYSSNYSSYRSYYPVYRYVYYRPSTTNCNFRTTASPQPFRPAATGCLPPAIAPRCKSLVDTTLPFIR